jgi:hypothetical protein
MMFLHRGGAIAALLEKNLTLYRVNATVMRQLREKVMSMAQTAESARSRDRTLSLVQ